MTAIDGSEPRRAAARHVWLPRQHGAWAMLLVPLLLGVAASRPYAWQLVLGCAAFAGYLTSATLQAWARARRPPEYRPPMLAYGTVFAVTGLLLVVAFPSLLLSLVVVVPTAIVVLGGARPGTRRDLANSLAQIAQALVLVPAAAYVSGEVDVERIVAYTAVAAAYLVGTVLVVRSVLRERGNEAFAALSVGFHVAVMLLAIWLYPAGYALLAVALTARAIALPVVGQRWASGSHRLRPIYVGVVEIVASVAVVVVSFAIPL
jgi:YwiC-like protein